MTFAEKQILMDFYEFSIPGLASIMGNNIKEGLGGGLIRVSIPLSDQVFSFSGSAANSSRGPNISLVDTG